MNRKHSILIGALVAGALLVTACSDAEPSVTTTAAADVAESTTGPVTTTTTTSTTSAPRGTSSTTTSPPLVVTGADIDPEVAEQLAADVAELIAATEDVRGLEFLTQPTVTILSPEELEARVRADIEEELVPEELAVENRLHQLLGLLGPADNLYEMLVDLYGEQVAGFYDPDTGEMVIGGDATELTPYTKTIVVHELVHALTDQHFLFHDDYEAMFDEERYEEGAAFQALIEGDATYFQIVYIQELPLAEQLALATEALALYEESTATSSVPAWMLNDLAFPYDAGQVFVQELVDIGGIAAVDAAYQNRPISTEVVMHPARYTGGETVLEVEPVNISLDGYEVHETSSYGEWGLRLLLEQTAAAGVAAQAANGWGGDSYQVLFDDDDIVFALAYKGDSEDDAFELADALITMVSESLEMGEALGEGGGVVFTPEDGRYAYLDRIGDGFVFVLSTDATAGAAAVDQMRVP